MATIIDYGAGNLKSVQNALQFLGEKAEVADSASQILGAERIIVPGVGNFGPAMNSLRKKGLDKAIKKAIAENTPFLGICLGMQLLFEESEESQGIKGLGIFKGKVCRIRTRGKLPQIGWNSVKKCGKSRLLKGIENRERMYFVNSFVPKPVDSAIAAGKTEYGEEFASVIEKGNVFATQFHPEKSGEKGLRIIKNFLDVVR